MRVVILPPFDRELFAGAGTLDLSAMNLFGLVEALDALAPGFAAIADVRAAFAVDGASTSDWTTSLADAGEVIVLPRVGGGQGLWRWR